MDIEHVIVYAFQDSLFPELVDCFGLEQAVEFVKFFGGTTIEVPSVDKIRAVMRDYDIFHTLQKTKGEESDEFESTQQRLSNEYSIPRYEVLNIYKRMKELTFSKRYMQQRNKLSGKSS